MRNSTYVLLVLVLGMAVALVVCVLDDCQLRHQVKALEAQLQVIDPVPVGPTTWLPMSWVQWLYKTPIPRSALAFILPAKFPERMAWRICFAPEALEQNPDFPEKVAQILTDMRNSPVLAHERDRGILSGQTLVMSGRKYDPNGVLEDRKQVFRPLRPAAQPAGPSTRR